MRMDKPREFWIDPLPRVPSAATELKIRYNHYTCLDLPGGFWPDRVIHVIEYSAYQKAVDALKRLVNSNVIKEAPFITYSEAYSDARDLLAELGEMPEVSKNENEKEPAKHPYDGKLCSNEWCKCQQ